MLKLKSFPKSKRLCQSSEFQAVFAEAKRIASQCFVFFVKPNPTKQPRLGIAVAKRKFSKANQRNRLKRLLREYFRCHCHELGGVDLIISVNTPLLQLQSAEINQVLSQQWLRLIKYCNTL